MHSIECSIVPRLCCRSIFGLKDVRAYKISDELLILINRKGNWEQSSQGVVATSRRPIFSNIIFGNMFYLLNGYIGLCNEKTGECNGLTCNPKMVFGKFPNRRLKLISLFSDINSYNPFSDIYKSGVYCYPEVTARNGASSS